MSEILQQFRSKYDSLKDLSDEDVLKVAHHKYVKDTGAEIDISQFSQSIGYQPIQAEPIEQEKGFVDTAIDYARDIIEPATEPYEQHGMLDSFVDTVTPEQQALEVEDQPISEMVMNKLESFGEGVVDVFGRQIPRGAVAGAKGAIPQFKQQIGGFLQQGEAPTEEEYNAMFDQDGFLPMAMGKNVNTYEKFVAAYESMNPVKTWLAKKGKEIAQEGREAKLVQAAERGTPEYYSQAITGSIINMVPTLGISIVGRRPDIGLGVMMAQSKGGSYEEGRLAGLDTNEAGMYSTLTSAAEIIPSALPIMKFMKPTGNFKRDLLEGGVAEGVQEVITAALQSGIDKGYINPDMTWGEAIDRMIDGAIVGFGAGTTISASTDKLAQKMADKDQKKQFEAELEAEFDKAFEDTAPDTEAIAIQKLSPDEAQLELQNVREVVETSKIFANVSEETKQKFQAVIDEAGAELKQAEQMPIDQAAMPEQEAVEMEVPEQVVEKETVVEPEQSVVEEVKPEDVPEEVAELQSILEEKQTQLQTYKDNVESGVWKQEAVQGLMNRLDEQINFFEGRIAEAKLPAIKKPLKPASKYTKQDKALINDFGDSLITQAAIQMGGLNREDFEITNDLFQKGSGFKNGVIGKPLFPGKGKGMTSDDFVEWAGEQGVYFDDVNEARDYIQNAIIKTDAKGRILSPEKLAEKQLVDMEEQAQAEEEQENIRLVDSVVERVTSKHVKTVGQNVLNHMANYKSFSEALDIEESRDSAATALFIDEAIKQTEIEIGVEENEQAKQVKKPESEIGITETEESFDLKSETESQRQAREKLESKKEAEKAQEKQKSIDKVEADKQVDDFSLTGSERKADVAAAGGQQDLLSQPKVKVQQETDYGTKPIETYNSFIKSIGEQTATAESIKKDLDNLLANKESIVAAMSQRKFTKAMVQRIAQSPRSDYNKKQLIESAFRQMVSNHALGDGVVVVFGGSGSFQDQIVEQVNNQTQADIDKAYEKQREFRAERKQAKDNFVKALTNPETLDEFNQFIRAKGKDGLSPEQLKAYDEIVAGSLKEEDKPKIVKGEAEAIQTERAQTKHTKTGADLFVVKMAGRVDKDKFRELSSKAKQLGGYYSSYSKGGAIPGFQFKTVESADEFEALLSGKDVETSDNQQAKVEVKQAKNADKLISLADKMENKATEAINQPRQTNTGRRASMAANATERAEKLLALSKTVRNIAVKLQDGELVHLGKINQVTQLEELISIQKRAIPNDLYEKGSFDGYSINRALKEGVTVEDYIANVEFPIIELDKSIVESIANSLKGKRGYARLSAELRRLPTGKRDSLKVLSNEQASKIMAANKAGLVESYNLSWLPDQVLTQSRLSKLGIKTGEQLRAAIRELESMREKAKGPDPIKALERELVGKKIAGYFPTPKTLVEQMMDYADIKPGHEVLEPSAGKGNIADQVKVSAPDAELDVIEFNSGLAAILEAKGYNVVGSDFMEYNAKKYDRIVMNPPFENFQDIEHVQHAYDLLKPGGKLVAIMGAGVKNSRKKAVEFRNWLDDAGSYIEELPEGSFKNAENRTGVSTVMVTIEKPDDQMLNYKDEAPKYDKPKKSVKPSGDIFRAPGHNFVEVFRSTGIPERREFVTIEGRRLPIPEEPQRIEPIMRELIKITGRRIYFGKIKDKSTQGFYRPSVGEIRTRRKNDVEILAHEMAHYLDIYSNVTIPNFKKLYKDSKYNAEVKALSYTDADNKIMEIEGFAEFVRLWLTNSSEAMSRAPNFYKAFVDTLARDRKLLNPMRDMQDLMHKFYFQGPDKLGQALIGKEGSFLSDFNQWAYRRDSRIRQQMIDRFHAARKVEQELTGKISKASDSAWKQLRIANGGYEGIADYVMNYGTLNYNDDGDLVKTGMSLHELLVPVKTIKKLPQHEGDSKIDLLMRYFAGRRALELHRQKRENLIPKQTALEWAKLGKDYPVFNDIFKEFQLFNNRMMDFYQDAGLLSADSRKKIEKMNKDYVPFNRIRETLIEGKGGSGSGFQKLKGGTANLNDILVNVQDGITANVKAALNNKAKERLYQYIAGHKDGAIFATKIAPDSKPVQVYMDEMVKKISEVLNASGVEFDGEIDLSDPALTTFWQHGVKPKVNESGNIVDTVMINGKPRYFEVQDPLLQEMLMAMNPESYSSFMNVMFGVKNFFTRTITLGVEFTGANLVRDTIGATFLSKNGFIPFVSSFKGMYSFFRKDKDFQNFMKSGGGYSSRLESSTKEGQARRRVSVDEFGVMTIPEKLATYFDNLASAFEYGTRIGEFQLAKRNEKSDMDAAFAAREISTDFGVLGANRFITGYIRTVPFLNAMIQSQDRVFREAFVRKKFDGNPTGMAMKAFLGITLPSLVLWLVNKDDEEYKQIPDYEKRTNWHIKSGEDRFIKIPKPYDVGFVYATMPELFFKYLEDEKGSEFAEGMIWTLSQMYGIDGVPAVMQGWWDLVRNKKWTGAPVVPQSMSDVEAPEQYNANTTETFIRFGEATGMSPIQAEHAFKAYTGYLGGYLLWGTEKMMWDESKFGEKPTSDVSSNIFLRRFLTQKVRPNTNAMEKFFDIKEKSDKVTATFKKQIDVRRALTGKLEGKGNFKDDRFFGLSGKEKEVLFGLNDSMNDLIKILYGKEGIKTAEIKIRYDKKLSGDEKREQMDKLWISRNKAFMTYFEKADQALQKAKQESKKLNQEK